jgi:hypothetical protein
VVLPNRVKVPADLTKFSGQDDTSTVEHIARYLMQLGEASADVAFRIRYFPLSLTGPAFTWFTVGGIRNQAFRISKIKECLQLPKFQCERPNGETPGALESIFVFQNLPFDQYPSSPLEPPNELRITQGVRVLVRLFVFFCDETPKTNFAHPDSLDLGFAWGVLSSLTSNNLKFECDPCFR